MNSITKKCDKCKREKDSRLFCSHPYENICRSCMAVLPTSEHIKPEYSTYHGCRYVYLISGAGLVKIGIAENVQSRLKNFMVGSPVELSLIYCFKSEDAKTTEMCLHGKFEHKRIHGEWFSLSNADIEWIKTSYP